MSRQERQCSLLQVEVALGVFIADFLRNHHEWEMEAEQLLPVIEHAADSGPHAGASSEEPAPCVPCAPLDESGYSVSPILETIPHFADVFVVSNEYREDI